MLEMVFLDDDNTGHGHRCAHYIVSADISNGVVISKSGTWDAQTKCVYLTCHVSIFVQR
jgi:hypothetical protein